MNRVLKDTVPGLVPGSAETSVQATLSAVGMDDHLTNPGQHHRLLIKPDAFHVSVLFQPTLAFLQRIGDVLPSGIDSTRASSAVMDDFVLKVYLPQLQEKVTELFLHSVNGRCYLGHDLKRTHSNLIVDRDLCLPAGHHNLQTLQPTAHQGYDAVNGIDQFPLCYASNITVSQGELLAADPHCCGGVLPEVLYKVPGTHLDRGTEGNRCRSENCLSGRLGAETGFTSLPVGDIQDT